MKFLRRHAVKGEVRKSLRELAEAFGTTKQAIASKLRYLKFAGQITRPEGSHGVIELMPKPANSVHKYSKR